VNASDFDHLDGSDGLGLDPDLTARLRAAAGAEPDLASAHAVLGRRVAGARRRRAVAVTGSAGLSVLLLGAVYAANTGDRGGRISSADAPAVASFGDDDSSTSVTATSVVTTVAPVVVTTLPGASVGSAASADPSSSAATSSSVDGAAAVDSVDQSDRELFDVTAASTEVRTVSGIGGSVDVKVENGVLSFASFPIAAPGFTAQVTRDEAGRLEVTFTSGTHLTRLRVRLDGTRLRADRHEEAIPSSSVPGAPTGTAPHTSTGDDDSDDDGSNDDGSNDSNDDGSNDSNDDDSDDSSGSGGSNDDSDDDQGSGGSGSNSGSGSNRGSGGSGSDD
jgi:uncharacterized membrane protein YgcG